MANIAIKETDELFHLQTQSVLSFTSCIIFHQAEILLQRRNAASFRFPFYISAFGGKVESYESPQQAVIRELKEELGIEVNANNLTYLGAVLECETNFTEPVFQYFLKYDDGIANCFEGEIAKFKNIEDVFSQKKIMSDVKWALEKCKSLKLLN